MTIKLKSPAAIEALNKAVEVAATAAANDAQAIAEAFIALQAKEQTAPDATTIEAESNALCALGGEFADWLEFIEATVATYHVHTSFARREFLEALGLRVTN